MLSKIRNTENIRTKRSISSIIFLIAIKGISIITSLLLVPVTIGYVNATRYGIWLSISSIIGWLSYFDMGLTHGFRNKFAEAKAKDDKKLACEYVSTTYFTQIVIFLIVYLVFITINASISWANVLNVPGEMEMELKSVFHIVALYFSLQMVLKPISTLLTADKKPEISSFFDTLGQVVSLIIIYVLTKTTEGSLILLANTISAVPVVVLLIGSLILFSTYYKDYRPRIRTFNIHRIKDILFLGGEFFIIQISSIFVFQSLNIIISNAQGPESVTVFNVAYKCFYVFNMVFSIILLPFWSEFTDAYTKGDYDWMKQAYSKLSLLSFITCGIVALFLIISPFVFHIWIGDAVVIPFKVSLMMAIYAMFTTLGCVPVTLLNGIGTVRIQMYVHVFYAIITIPILLYLLSNYELYVGLIFVVLNPFTHFIISSIQLNMILNKTAYGIWKK